MLGLIISIVGFVLGLIQSVLWLQYNGYVMKSNIYCSGASVFADECEDFYDEDEAAARTSATGSGTQQLISTSSNFAIVAGFLLCIVAILNIQIKFDSSAKEANHSSIISLTKTSYCFQLVVFIYTCSILGWEATYKDKDDSLESGDHAMALMAFNIINFVFLLIFHLTSLTSLEKAKCNQRPQ